VPFSKLRLSIVIQQSGERGDDVDRSYVSALQVVDRDLAMRVTALEIFSGFDRNLFDVAIGPRLAVDEDFEDRGRVLFHFSE
jgi:hypothetical protein